MLNISQSKGSHIMKFGQLIEHNKRNIFLQKSCRLSKRERLFPDLFFSKMLYDLNVSGLQLNCIIFRSLSTWHTVKTNCIKL